MAGKNRFYCLECGHFLDRRCVNLGEDFRYYCKYCGSPVIQTSKVKQAIIKDFIEYQVSKGNSMEEFE